MIHGIWGLDREDEAGLEEIMGSERYASELFDSVELRIKEETAWLNEFEYKYYTEVGKLELEKA